MMDFDVMNAAAQLLTIIAFTAHVIAGCCAHHNHHQHAHTTQTAVADASSHGCAHAHDHVCSQQALDPGRTSRLNEAHPSPSDAPCDGDHSCSEGSCHYLSGKSLNLPTLTDALAAVSVERCSFQPAELTVRRFDRVVVEPLLPATSASRCALLQTWQI